MADAIQKGIEAAQQDLVKDAEEKLLEEVNRIFYVILIFKILYLHKSHNTPLLPPKNLHRHCFRLLLGHVHVRGEIANNEHAKVWGGGGLKRCIMVLCK